MGTVDFTFPTDTFTLPGNPAAVRESARRYGDFSSTTATAAASIRSIATGDWIGDEADLFRERAAPLPSPLENANVAFALVVTALRGFADTLESCQARMAGEADDARAAWARLRTARDQVAQHLTPPTGTTTAPDAQAAFDAETATLRAAATRALDAWNGHVSNASRLRAQVDDAARRAGQQIRGAARMSPTAGQSWFSRHLERAGNWVDEHGAGVREWIGKHATLIRGVGEVMSLVGKVLLAVGAALATISFVAGLFSFGIGWLGELPAGALMAWGGGLWVAGDALQDVADWGEGKIDGQQLIVDGMWLVGGLAAGFGIGKIAERLGPVLAEWLENKGVTTAVRDWLESRGISVPTPGEAAGATGGSGAGGKAFEGAWTGENGLTLTAEEASAVGKIYAKAAAAEPEITKTMQAIQDGLPGSELKGLDYRLKEPDSLMRKVSTELDNGVPLGEALGDMKDVVRYTLTSQPGSYAAEVRAATDQLMAKGYEPVKWKNTWGADGYQGINSFWRDPASGQVFEVQFHTPQSFELKMSTHDLYDIVRDPGSDPAAVAKAEQRSNEILSSATPPPGAAEIPKPPGT